MSISSFSFQSDGERDDKPRNKRRSVKKLRQNSQDRHDLEYRGRPRRPDYDDDDDFESEDDLDLDFDEDEDEDEDEDFDFDDDDYDFEDEDDR